MNAQHSPGPWRISYERGTTQIRTADNESIMCDETYYPWVPEKEADWHLIAAAPDLLEALDNLWAWVKNWDAEFMDDPEFDRSIYEAAIAKAKGGDA